MEKKQRILEYRQRLDQTLTSRDLVHKESIKNLVRNHLVRSSTSDIHGYVDNFLEKRTDEVSHFLDMLRSASRSDNEASKADGMPDRDWKLKQDNEDFRVMYREGSEGTPFHTLLVEGFVEGPLDVCLCLSWEAGLFRKWWPQFSVPPFKIMTSDCVQEVRIGEEIIHLRVKVAWPVSAREMILHYFELEYFEDDLVIVLLKSISDTEGVEKSTHGFSRDGIPDAKDFVRMDVVGGFVMQKVTPDISYFRTIATMDIKLDFVPPSLINFCSRQLIGSGFKLYKKAVASIAKGDDDFSRALQEPLYVRIREGLTPTCKLKRALNPEALKSGKSAKLGLEGLGTQIPQMDTMVVEHTQSSDSHATTSSQEGKPIPVMAYNGEIEEVEVEQERQSAEKYQTHHDKTEVSKENDLRDPEIEEVEVEQERHLKEDELMDDSMDTSTEYYYDNEKTMISPKVVDALRVLDNAISMVREGFSIQNWSGFGINHQEVAHLQRVATGVGSTSSEERSDDGVSLKPSKVDNMEALWEDESSSGFFDIRHDKQDSPPQVTPGSPKRNSTSLNTSQDNDLSSPYNGKIMLEAPVVDNLSRDNTEAFVEVNGVHKGNSKVGESRQKKQRRCCLYFFAADR